MYIKPILNDDDYKLAIEQIGELMHAKLDTPDGYKLEVLVTLVETYEAISEESLAIMSELRNALRMTLNWTTSPENREWVEMVLNKHTP
jgi:antitoxin component HigA of HigAB toxin-antitoxin module